MRHGQHSQRRGRERCRQRFLHARRQLPAERQRIIEGKEQFVARLVEHALDNATYALLASPALDDQPAVLDGLALANAWLDLERRHREQQWTQLQRFLAHIPPGGGDDDALHLPASAAKHALIAAMRCGWITPSLPNQR